MRNTKYNAPVCVGSPTNIPNSTDDCSLSPMVADDLILLRRNRDYGALLIEMKTPTGRQSDSQKKWQFTLCSENEYKYVVCRSLDDFIKEVNDYLNND